MSRISVGQVLLAQSGPCHYHLRQKNAKRHLDMAREPLREGAVCAFWTSRPRIHGMASNLGGRSNWHSFAHSWNGSRRIAACAVCRCSVPTCPKPFRFQFPGTFYETSSALKSPDLRSFWRSELGYLDFLHAVLCSFVLLGDRRIHVSGAFSKKTGSGLPQIPPG